MQDWRRCLAEDPRCSKKWACFRSRHCQSGRRSGACAWIQAVNFQQATTESLTSLSRWSQDAHTSPAQAIHYPSASSDTPFLSFCYSCCKYILKNSLSHLQKWLQCGSVWTPTHTHLLPDPFLSCCYGIRKLLGKLNKSLPCIMWLVFQPHLDFRSYTGKDLQVQTAFLTDKTFSTSPE